MSYLEKISPEALRQLINNGETAKLEFKINPPRQTELAERICGMANSKTGGIILFGIEDNTKRLVGIDEPTSIFDELLKAARSVTPPVQLTTEEPQVFVIDGKNIVGIEIPPNNGTLYQCNTRGFLVRKGSHTVPMTAEELRERFYSYGLIDWEGQICSEATLEDLDQTLIDRYLSSRNERNLRRLRYNSREELLKGLKSVAVDSQNVLHPTNTGLLMFGAYPQQFLPQSEVVCVHYTDKLGVKKYVDRKNLAGTLPELIDAAEDWLRLRVKVGAVIEGFKRIDLPEYPLEALREAVVNAIVHRDYSRRGETVRIFMYSDRIEIRSPGALMPGITVEELKHMTGTSLPRNPQLAQLLRDLPGYMERIGGGIRLMINEMRELNLPEPEFVEHHDFIVTFRSSASLDEESKSSLTNNLNDRQLIGLKIVQTKGSITNSEYREATGVTDRTALRDLSEMVELGILVSRGIKRSQRYFLA